MRKISVADYFVEVLIANGVTDVFGYQGGMIAYIFDSLGKYRDKISYHVCCNEQGAAFAACSYSRATGKLGVAITTSGPGFTNLVTGIANAWFDSLPVLFVSGNVNTKDKKRVSHFRQNGFQEIQAATIASPITKASIEVELDTNYIQCFGDAIAVAMQDRKGPVYLDLPINICREIIEVNDITPFVYTKTNEESMLGAYFLELANASRPVIIAGDGINQACCKKEFIEIVNMLQIPVVTTMPAIDLLPSDSPYRMGYIGGTARREAGIVLQNADYLLSIGTRLCSKQVGHNMSLFAPKAKQFIRVDIDENEFERKLKSDEIEIRVNLRYGLQKALRFLENQDIENHHEEWTRNCTDIKRILSVCDNTTVNKLYENIGKILPEDCNIVLDVGKNLVYAAQSLVIKDHTNVYMSAGLGSMGYAIPAGIGAYYGNKKPTYVFSGDGGAQMNIQELNTIVKNNLPIKIFILNNRALGNILLFQESYLDSRFVATLEKANDYFSCDFTKIAEAYGMKAVKAYDENDLMKNKELFYNDSPVLFEYEYDDCPALPGIVAGGEFLKEGSGLDNDTITEIKKLISI